MDWFNFYGLIIMVIIMIPNIIYSIKNKNITKTKLKVYILYFQNLNHYICHQLTLYVYIIQP